MQLLKRMQASVGLEPLPQAVQRVLHESGLVAWLQQQQREEQQQGEQEQQQGAAAPSSEAVAEDLPLPLRCVLLKAQQLAADWERQQQQVVHTQQPLDGQQVQTQQQLDSGQGQLRQLPTAWQSSTKRHRQRSDSSSSSGTPGC